MYIIEKNIESIIPTLSLPTSQLHSVFFNSLLSPFIDVHMCTDVGAMYSSMGNLPVATFS